MPRTSSHRIFPEPMLRQVYEDLGVGVSEVKSVGDDFLRAQEYAYFFRALFDSTYLSAEMSERALSLLAMTDSRNGIVAGIPEGIKVAHKFGERTVVDSETKEIQKRELHDCGIVYAPERPYVLCIMTEGEDFSRLERAIQGISRTVYQSVSGKR